MTRLLLQTGRALLLETGGSLVMQGTEIPADFSISVPGSGNYNADTLDATNATNGAGNSNGTGFYATTAAQWTVLSVNSSRDQEVTTSGDRFRAYLRYVDDRAVFLRIDKTGVDGSTGILTIGIADGLTASSELATTYYNLFSVTDANTSITGFSGSTTFTFGVSGFDIYVKIDGTERVRIQDFHHVVSGKVGIKPSGTYRIGATTVNFMESAFLYSNIPDATYDVRDLTGWKNTTTTGSISAAGTTLTVASASGLAVGDVLIVEIGAEAGAGARGTKGVGGTWPALSYADSTARAADTSQANNTYAWQEDTGDVYRWTTGSPGSWAAVSSANYYTTKAVPRSLQARITAISGTSITLDTAATVAATNANVYVDMTPIISHFAQYQSLNGEYIHEIAPNPKTISIPAGTFYMAAGPLIRNGGEHGGAINAGVITVQGAGKTSTVLRSPKGVHSATIVTKSQGNSATVRAGIRDLHLYGNCRFTGFGLAWKQSHEVTGYTLQGTTPVRSLTKIQLVSDCTETTVTYPYGAFVTATQYCDVINVKATDAWQSGAGVNLSSYCNITGCDIVLQDGLAQYIQWQIQYADSTGGTCSNCTIDSAILTGGIEAFRGSGQTFTDITSTNGVFSMNTADSWTVTNFTLTVEANSRLSGGGLGSVAGSGVPAFGVNTNIGGSVSNGGTLTNYVLDQQGVIDASNNLLTGFSVAASCPNIALVGTSISNPDYVSGGTNTFAAVYSDGANTDISNLTVTGQSVYAVTGSGRRNIHLAGGSGSSITNCTAGDTYVA